MEVFVTDNMVCFKKYRDINLSKEDAQILYDIIKLEYSINKVESLENILNFVKDVIIPDSEQED